MTLSVSYVRVMLIIMLVATCAALIAGCAAGAGGMARSQGGISASAACEQATPTAWARQEEAIRGVLVQQQKAWNGGDLEEFMEGYWDSPELVFTSGGRVQRGYEPLRERYRATYGRGAEMGVLAFSQLEVHPLGPCAAWALGRWQLARAGERPGGIFTLVLRRIGTEWKIVHDHTSSDPAAPPGGGSP